MALRITARLRGDKQLKAALRKRGREAPKILARALFREAEPIMTKSKRLVPVDTGALRSSGHVEPPEIRGKRVRVFLVYGGASAEYAVFVHENTNARHNPPTQAKYLEQPLMEAIPGLGGRLAARVRGDMKR